MADGPGLETFANTANSLNGAHARDAGEHVVEPASVRNLLIFIGLAVSAAALAYGVMRAVLRRRPSDPTTERIQQLIDEANRLLKQLDEKQPAP